MTKPIQVVLTGEREKLVEVIVDDSFAELDDTFIVPKTESGAIDLTKATPIAEGGTHVLYRFPDAPFVFKLMKKSLSLKEIETLEQKYAVLYDCFDQDGKQRCLREQHIVHRVFLEGKELEEAVLSIVPYELCFKSEIKFDFKIEPTEFDPYLMEQEYDLFEKANTALIGGEKVDFEPNDYVLFDQRIGDIVHRLDGDDQLRTVMIEFLNHYRDFYQKTNIILDAMGYENILFFKDSRGDWQFKIGSAIKHDTGKYTQQLFGRVHSGETIDWANLVNYTHAYFSPANIRALNVCAMKLGLEPVITDVGIASEDLFKISQELSVGERMLSCARHGDFDRMNKLFEESKMGFSFNLRDFWAHSLIADEYSKHGQSPEALAAYLKAVSVLPVDFPENTRDAKRMREAHAAIIARKNSLEKEIVQQTTPSFVQNMQLSFWSSAETTAVSTAEEMMCEPQSATHHYKEQLQKTKRDDSSYILPELSSSFL